MRIGSDHKPLPHTVGSKVLVVTLESQQAIVVDLRRRRRGSPAQINGINGDHANGMGHEHLPSSSKPAHDPWQTVEVRMDLAEIFEKDRPLKENEVGEGTSADM